jgi:hypothetical protein
LWQKFCPVSLWKNCISRLDLWIAMIFASKEYRIDRIGPSLIESEVGATWGSKGTAFHEKTWITKKKSISKQIIHNHLEYHVNANELWIADFNIWLPDQMLERSVAYFHHHKINPLFLAHYIVKEGAEYKHATTLQTHLN